MLSARGSRFLHFYMHDIQKKSHTNSRNVRVCLLRFKKRVLVCGKKTKCFKTNI